MADSSIWEPSNTIALISLLIAAATAILAALVPVWLDYQKGLREAQERSESRKYARLSAIQAASIRLIQSISHFRLADPSDIHFSAGQRSALEAASELALRFSEWEVLVQPYLTKDQSEEASRIGQAIYETTGEYEREGRSKNKLYSEAPSIMTEVRKITNEVLLIQRAHS